MDRDARFSEDTKRYPKTNMLKAIHYDSGRFATQLLNMLGDNPKQKVEIKCIGIGWSDRDQKPYIITDLSGGKV